MEMTSPLQDRTYRRLFTAQIVALAGTGLSTVALALLAYDLAGGDAGVVLGLALTLKMVAYVGIAPIVGGFAHRLPRRRLLIALDVARAGFVLCLPFVTAQKPDGSLITLDVRRQELARLDDGYARRLVKRLRAPRPKSKK